MIEVERVIVDRQLSLIGNDSTRTFRPTFSPRIPIISISSLMIETMLILVPNTLLTTLVKSFNISLCIGTPSTPRQRSSRAARRRIIVDREVKFGGRRCEGLRAGLSGLVGDTGFEGDADGESEDDEEALGRSVGTPGGDDDEGSVPR